MSLQSIIKRADAMGIAFVVVGDRLRYAPKSRTPEDLVDMLREHKEELVAFRTWDT